MWLRGRTNWSSVNESGQEDLMKRESYACAHELEDSIGYDVSFPQYAQYNPNKNHKWFQKETDKIILWFL